MNETHPTEFNSSQFYDTYKLYILDNSKEALEHLILVAAVYIIVCLGVYQLICRRSADGHPVKCVRFPKCQRVLIVTAHPDDECMFFGPTILSLLRRNNCNVYLLCLSNGNFEQKGNIRREELWQACKILKLRDENITLVHATHLLDDPQIHWKSETIASHILKEIETLDIDALITFDREGVSHHPNHCAIYYATASLCLAGLIPNGCKIFTLDSINVCRKYMFILDLLVSLVLSTNWCIVEWNEMKTIQCAMKQHKSQLLWFRKLYILFSRYMIINSLREMNSSDIELEMQINDT